MQFKSVKTQLGCQGLKFKRPVVLKQKHQTGGTLKFHLLFFTSILVVFCARKQSMSVIVC